ncbi:hypothetical protein Glove_13g21 [Diversispora epigaea]|uniref:Uncharacterized protein n=1 Tax=Diversispora epigaea TaxID=1348612 RepID=A0A397JPP2_9GLOM|nr:hypothetical protein Glove_13g21 [Diversispora epigaea]
MCKREWEVCMHEGKIQWGDIIGDDDNDGNYEMMRPIPFLLQIPKTINTSITTTSTAQKDDIEATIKSPITNKSNNDKKQENHCHSKNGDIYCWSRRDLLFLSSI